MTTGSFLCSGLALLWFSSLESPATSATVTIALGMVLLGGASGFFVSPNNSVTLDLVSPADTGAASGCLWCVGFLGAALGTAFSAMMLHHGIGAGGLTAMRAKLTGAPDPALVASFLHAQTQTFHILIVFSVLGGLLCFMRGSGPHQKKTA